MGAEKVEKADGRQGTYQSSCKEDREHDEALEQTACSELGRASILKE